MSVNMLVDIVVKNAKDFISSREIFPTGTIVLCDEILDEGSVKISNGEDHLNETKPIQVSSSAWQNWLALAKNSGTYGRLVTLPDMTIAYGSYQMDEADLIKAVEGFGEIIGSSYQEKENGVYGSLLLKSENNISISNAVEPDKTEDLVIEEIVLANKDGRYNFILADQKARANLVQLENKVNKYLPGTQTNPSEPSEPEITPTEGEYFGAYIDESHTERRLTGPVSSVHLGELRSADLFLNSEGDWTKIHTANSLKELDGDKPVSLQLFKNNVSKSAKRNTIYRLNLREKEWVKKNDMNLVSCEYSGIEDISTVLQDKDGKETTVYKKLIKLKLPANEVPKIGNRYFFYLPEKWKDNPNNLLIYDYYINFETTEGKQEAFIIPSEEKNIFLSYLPEQGYVIIQIEEKEGQKQICIRSKEGATQIPAFTPSYFWYEQKISTKGLIKNPIELAEVTSKNTYNTQKRDGYLFEISDAKNNNIHQSTFKILLYSGFVPAETNLKQNYQVYINNKVYTLPVSRQEFIEFLGSRNNFNASLNYNANLIQNYTLFAPECSQSIDGNKVIIKLQQPENINSEKTVISFPLPSDWDKEFKEEVTYQICIVNGNSTKFYTLTNKLNYPLQRDDLIARWSNREEVLIELNGNNAHMSDMELLNIYEGSFTSENDYLTIYPNIDAGINNSQTHQSYNYLSEVYSEKAPEKDDEYLVFVCYKDKPTVDIPIYIKQEDVKFV